MGSGRPKGSLTRVSHRDVCADQEVGEEGASILEKQGAISARTIALTISGPVAGASRGAASDQANQRLVFRRPCNDG